MGEQVPDPEVTLRPLGSDELPSFIERGRREYADSMVAQAGLSREQAEAKSARDTALLFPDGKRQPSHYIYVLEDAGGEPVGRLWWGERRPPEGGPARAWVYDVEIAERMRGRGLGRLAMELLEDDVRAHGLDAIDLNVWGGNEVARTLYRSLGYEERSVMMGKELT